MSEIFESKWGETKSALTEGLEGNRKKTMDVILENTKRYLSEQATAGATSAGNVATLNRVILPVIRRVMPTVIANEIVGVQPMTGPTGLIFAMKARYVDTTTAVGRTEALFNEADTDYSAAGTHAGTDPFASASANTAIQTGYTTGAGDTTAAAEIDASIAEMSFTIEKATVTAKSRALKAEYTIELAQDLKAIHGLDAETELANILSAEILAR